MRCFKIERELERNTKFKKESNLQTVKRKNAPSQIPKANTKKKTANLTKRNSPQNCENHLCNNKKAATLSPIPKRKTFSTHQPKLSI